MSPQVQTPSEFFWQYPLLQQKSSGALRFLTVRKWQTLRPMECCVVNIDLKREKQLKKKWQILNYNKKWFDQIRYFHFFLQCFSSHSFFSYIYSCTLFWLGTNHLLETFFLDWIVFQPNIIELPSSQQKRIKIYAKVTGSIGNSTFSQLF